MKRQGQDHLDHHLGGTQAVHRLGCFIHENEHPAHIFYCEHFRCRFLNSYVQHHLPQMNQDQ